MKTKISVEEAFKIIGENANPLCAEVRDLQQSLGQCFSSNIRAPISLPPFDNSAVDGYALGKIGSAGDEYQVVDTIGAGELCEKALQGTQACRIMTGAKIPTDTKCVIMQEHVEAEGDVIKLVQPVRLNDHIRFMGEDLNEGQSVARSGMKVTPAQIGLLSALGIAKAKVTRQPTVTIISTGDELVDPGKDLPDGKVYYCTGPMLKSLCESAGVLVKSVQKISDEKEAIIDGVKDALQADVVIMIGGMASGLFDFGRYAFEKTGVSPLFFRGLWRPGKPLFFGKSNEKLVFGLPGNPVAAFVMFKIFVEPALERLAGGKGKLGLKRARIVGDGPKNTPNTQFLRAQQENDALRLLSGQGSHQLYTLSLANSIVFIPPNCSDYENKEFNYLSLES